MKNTSRCTFLLPLAALVLAGAAGPAHCAPAQGKGGGLGMGAINGAEMALGKKLSASQKAKIVAAAKEREKKNAEDRKKNMKAFRVQLAKIVGMPLSQLEAKEKAARAKTKGKR